MKKKKNLPDARNTPADPRTVDCPVCDSKVDQACIDLETGRLRKQHYRRFFAAEFAKGNDV